MAEPTIGPAAARGGATMVEQGAATTGEQNAAPVADQGAATAGGVAGLSLVVPAFDEESRLPRTLEAASRALPELTAASEIVVVDDGSRDGTAAAAEAFSGRVPVRVVRLGENRGKGAAVAAGVAAARYPLVAFTDADSPYDLASLRPMLAALVSGRADVAIGARELPASQVNRGYGLLRLISGKGFSWLTWLAIGLPFRDSQCGLKAFRADVARALFAVRTVDRFGFDFELLAAAVTNGFAVERFPVRLTHDDDSRIDLVRDSLEMARDLWRVRRNLRRGAYRIAARAVGGRAGGPAPAGGPASAVDGDAAVGRDGASDGAADHAACPLCREAGFRARFARGGHRMVECVACGLWYLRPMPGRAELERFYGEEYFASSESCAQGYDDYAAMADDLRETFRRRLRLIAEPGADGACAAVGAQGTAAAAGVSGGAAGGAARTGLRVLDVGGGYGYLADVAAEDARFAERWVVEASAEAASRVSPRHRTVVGWFPDVALPEEAFDVVSLQDCLEHLPDPRAALARVREVLRPGGILLATTPNTRSWLARLQGAGWVSLKFPEHVVLFDAATLRRALAEAGFRVQRMVAAGQMARLDFLVSRALAGWPRLARRLVALVRALGGDRLRLWVPSGSLTVVATVDKPARAGQEPACARSA